MTQIASKAAPVKQFNPHEFYTLANTVHPLASFDATDKTISEVFLEVYNAKTTIYNLTVGKPLPLPICKSSATKLWWALDAIIPTDQEKFEALDFKQPVPRYLDISVRAAASDLETVLSAELSGSSVYYVSKQLIYDTADLIDRAENALGEAAAKVSNEVKKDFNAAGRSLAFEIATGSGFHAMRAVEAVLRDYHRLALSLPPSRKSPQMANCIDQLKAKGTEDPKLMDILDHIRDLHRNTLMHPDAFLTMPEALRLFDIGKSAISAMSERIEILKALPAGSAIPVSAGAALAITAPVRTPAKRKKTRVAKHGTP